MARPAGQASGSVAVNPGLSHGVSFQMMPESNHFGLEPLASGAYACIHKPGGAAYSNAGIVDLGGRTLVIDAMHTLAAGRDLCRTAEALFGRPADTLLLTHAHGDHWIGASVFPAGTALLATGIARQGCLEWGPRFLEDHQNPAAWQEWLSAIEERLKTEQDERVRAGLEQTIAFIGHMTAELADYRPRYVDRTFEDELTLRGDWRSVQARTGSPLSATSAFFRRSRSWACATSTGTASKSPSSASPASGSWSPATVRWVARKKSTCSSST
jgi:hypothetical protein